LQDYLRLPTFNRNGDMLFVVETPRGSSAKFKFEPALETFFYSRSLASGLVYPFDWGFIPSTCAQDGDPLDGMVLHQAASYPGIVIPCCAVGVLEVEQMEHSVTRRNDRIFLMPATTPHGTTSLSEALKNELVQFFQASVFGTEKKLVSLRWESADAAIATVRKSAKNFGAGSPSD
jgi:inorganic pyrophosphatase